MENQIKASNPATLALISVGINADNIFTPASYGAAVYTAPYKYSADLVVSEFQGTPNFTQVAGSPALTGAAFTDAKVTDAFFEKVAYKGAVGTTDWTTGWANFNPQVLPYTTPGAVK